MLGQYWLLIGIIVLAVCLDQGSKAFATMSLDNGETISIIEDFVELRLRHNRGVAWGLGASLPDAFQRVAFPLLGAIIGVVLVIYYKRLRDEDRLQRVAVALVLGGGLGNLIDRIRGGSVVDFIAIHMGGGGWTMSGTFNLGDVWLIVGVVLLAIMTGVRGSGGTRSTMIEGGSP